MRAEAYRAANDVTHGSRRGARAGLVRRWRIRHRLTLVIALAAAAPAAGLGLWIGAWLNGGTFNATALWLGGVWTILVAAVAAWYGFMASGSLVGPLEALARSLRRFDPGSGDSAHPALVVARDDPEETATLKRALRQALDRIVHDRLQREAVLGGLMHDLKTPIVAQSLLLERLHVAAPTEREIIIDELRRSSIGAVARLNRLIDVMRADAMNASEESPPTKLVALVGDVCAELAPLVASRGIVLRTKVGWDVAVAGEPVHRALENVVSNAIRFAHSSVLVETMPGLVRVTDDGPGFAIPFDEAVDPFRPGPTDHHRSAGTLGLGLYIAHRSLKAIGGRVKLESSRPGKTVVLLYLGVSSS